MKVSFHKMIEEIMMIGNQTTILQEFSESIHVAESLLKVSKHRGYNFIRNI